MIVLTDRLLKDTRLRDDDEWHNFLINYSTIGYTQIMIPNTDRKVLIKNEIMIK